MKTATILIFPLIVLLLIACNPYITTPTAALIASPAAPTPLPTQTPTAIATPDGENITIQATVYVRQSADVDSEAIGNLTTGQSVEIVKCDGNWCQIKRPSGFVWRGCTSNNPDRLLCQAKP